MQNVTEYLSSIHSDQRTEYMRIKAIVMDTVPDASETITYKIPTFTYMGRPLLYFGAFKNHMSLFPTPEPIDTLKDQLSEYKVSKGTIQFTADKPVSKEIIVTMLELRVAAIDA